MKIIHSTILCLIQFSVLGQLSYWTQETVAKNKIEKVYVFQKVPKTNPEYYKEPRGYMAISETSFDKNGLVIEDLCKNCAIQFHGNPPAADIDQKFFYDKNRLIRVEKMRFEKSTTAFYYDTVKNRRLKIGFDKEDKRNEVEFAFLNSQGKETHSYSIDFDNILIREDSVIQIFLSKSSTEYKEKSKTRKELSYMVGTNIDRRSYEIFKNSLDFDEILKTFEGLSYSHLELRYHVTTYYDNNGNEIRLVDQPGETPYRKYRRDKNGLIKNWYEYWPKFTAAYSYRYKFRK